MATHQWSAILCSVVCVLSVLSIAPTCMAKTRSFYWEVSIVNYTRNCYTKPLLVVNGQYPGPAIEVDEGDRVIIYVKNSGNQNLTIHWHGIRQVRSNWADGVASITECPIKPGNSEIYDFVVFEQRGTTFWHAHITWLRATIHGAFITKPKNGYPFPKPYEDKTLILGEWWNQDVEVVLEEGLAEGGTFPLADATTIDGYPGALHNCSETEGLAVIDVIPGKTYLLRLINSALNVEFFFAIANHTLTVVEADSNYVKPFTVDKGVLIAPGQTLNVLVTADQSPATYYMAGESYQDLLVTDEAAVQGALAFIANSVPPIPTTGLFRYKDAPVLGSNCVVYYPVLPAANDTAYSVAFEASLRTLHPEKVPSSENIRHLLYVVGTAAQPCTAVPTCNQSDGYRVTEAVNNISFVAPTTAILPAYYYNIPGVYSPTFPDFPTHPYDYTAAESPPLPGQVSLETTRVTYVEYGTVMELVLQDNNHFLFDTHPFHLHGTFFYVLGQGFGNYDPTSDPEKFNYYDPPARFTVNVPTRGWVAIRWKADNPGVWFLHCHLEKHLTWGLAAVFIVKNGNQPDQTLPGPLGKQTVNPC